MTRSRSSLPATGQHGFNQQIKEIDRFMEGRDKVHKTMRRLVQRLEKAKVSYAIVGGMALTRPSLSAHH